MALQIAVAWHPEDEMGKEFALALHAHVARRGSRPVLRYIGLPTYFRCAPAPGKQSGAPIAFIPDRKRNPQVPPSALFVLVGKKMLIDSEWKEWVRQEILRADYAPDLDRVYPVALCPNAYDFVPELPAVNFIRIEAGEQIQPCDLFLIQALRTLCRHLDPDASARQNDPMYPGSSAGQNVLMDPRKCGPGRDVTLFLSHAKCDRKSGNGAKRDNGETVALTIKEWIDKAMVLDYFFDARDIAAGYNFETEIEGGLQRGRTCLVAVQSDIYSTRRWCQTEVLLAKKHGCPVVVVDALRQGEERSFPYAGNVPTIHWLADDTQASLEERNSSRAAYEVVRLALTEVLRHRYLHGIEEQMRRDGRIPAKPREACLLARPPELLSMLYLSARTAEMAPESATGVQPGERCRCPSLVLYPDPPLAKAEASILSAQWPEVVFSTPTLWLGGSLCPTSASVEEAKQAPRRLEGRTVALSLSESADLAALGLSEEHLLDAMSELARYLLASGAKIAYGGRPGKDGFTDPLLALVDGYNKKHGRSYDPIESYLAWPYYVDAEEWLSDFVSALEKHRIPPPEDVVQRGGVDLGCARPQTDAEHYAASLALTEMRRQMANNCNARVVLGGKLANFRGRYPGVAEEALFTLRAGKPLFVLGGFGGCAHALARALQGETVEEFSEAFQRKDPLHDHLLRIYAEEEARGFEGAASEGELRKADYAGLAEAFRAAGLKGLNNGLSEQENLQLISATEPTEMAHLILKGLLS